MYSKYKVTSHSHEFNIAQFGHSEGEAFQEICPVADAGDIIIVHGRSPRSPTRRLVHLALKEVAVPESFAFEVISDEWKTLIATLPEVSPAIDVFVVPADGVRGALRGGVYNLDLHSVNDQIRLRRSLHTMYDRLLNAKTTQGLHIRDLSFSGWGTFCIVPSRAQG